MLWYYAEMEKRKCLEDTKESEGRTPVDGLMMGRKSSKVIRILIEKLQHEISIFSDGLREE